jgi:IMP dehydrogenase
MVPFRGSVETVIHQFCGGLRYSLGYCGTKTIQELNERAKFIKVTPAGLKEAHPHDVTIIKDAPNYTQV